METLFQAERRLGWWPRGRNVKISKYFIQKACFVFLNSYFKEALLSLLFNTVRYIVWLCENQFFQQNKYLYRQNVLDSTMFVLNYMSTPHTGLPKICLTLLMSS
jgi:hypothetical protein